MVDIDHMLSSIDARIKAASSNIVVGDIDSIVNRNDRNTNPPADAENTSASVKKSEPVRKQNPYINRDPVNVKNKVIREIIETDDESEEEDGEEILLVSSHCWCTPWFIVVEQRVCYIICPLCYRLSIDL